MDFNDTKEEAEFRQQAANWISANLPTQQELAGKDEVDRARFWLNRRYKDGWGPIGWPEEYGGKGATAIQQIIWEQEEERLGAPSTHILGAGISLTAGTLMTYGSPELKEKYLPAIASGEHMWTQLFSEPAAGSDLAGLRTKAEPTDGGWIINGQKIWTSFALKANMGILVTRTDPTVAKHKGLTYFIVDLHSPGIDIRPIKQINGDSEFNEVYFTDVFIPDHNRIGEVGQGWHVALTTLMNERASAVSEESDMYFHSKHLLELVRIIAEEDPDILEYSDVYSRIADWMCTESGLKYTNQRILSALSRGDTPGPESSIGKLVAAAKSQEVANLGLDLLEQLGDSGLGDKYADAFQKCYKAFMKTPGTRILGGTDEVMLNIVAERVLGMPADIRADKNVPFNEIPTTL